MKTDKTKHEQEAESAPALDSKETQSFPAGFKPRYFSDQKLYQLKLPVFNGPFDLLLFLIRKHKLEISDIPVAHITQQYLDYLEVMKELDVEIATEFLVMAAELIELKARMLLPKEVDDTEETEEIDPREDLARRLQEYERYQAAAQDLVAMPLHEKDTFDSGMSKIAKQQEGEQDVLFGNLDPFLLITTLAGILRSADANDRVQMFEIQRISIRKRMLDVVHRLGDGLTRAFRDLFALKNTKLEIIVTFMAVLELAKLNLLHLYQAEDDGDIYVVPQYDSAEAAAGVIYHSAEEDASSE